MLGNCRILEQVGQGGMGTVYRAYQLALGRYVAVKVISPAVIADPNALARFRREAQTIAGFRHPNILTVYDFGEQDGMAFLIAELATGGTLKGRLGLPIHIAESVALLRPIGSALDYAHARGVVHRDVKPANVLVHDDGTLVLSDFGLAHLVEGDHSQLTATGLLVGTPAYMAPEQGLGSHVGPAADLYALGVIAYEMLTGSVPFSGPTPISVMLAHVQAHLPPARERNPELPASIEMVLQRALAKQPADRFATASALVRALEVAGLQAQPPAVQAITEITPRASTSVAVPTVDPGVTERRRVAVVGAPAGGEPAPRRAVKPRVLVIAGGFLIVLLGVLLASTAILQQIPFVQPEPTATPAAAWQVLPGGQPGDDSLQFAALAVDHLGFVYVAIDDQRIQKLSPNGTSVAGPWGTPGGPVELDEPRGVAVDAAGSVYVTEWGKVQRIQKFAPMPQDWLQTVAQWGAAGQFSSPAGIAVDQAGNMYVAERDLDRVRKLSPAGAPLAQWGTPGSRAGQFSGPMGIALDKQGNLYVADAGNDRIQKLSPTGSPLASWGKTGGAAGEFVGPIGVAVDNDDNIFVADTGNSRIQKLSPSGASLALWGQNGSAVGEFDRPSGVAVDATGDVYVTDSGNHRMQKLPIPAR